MGYNYKPLYYDTDSCIPKNLTILKENKIMNREYIVVHPSTDGKAGIVFKDSIKAVLKDYGTNGTEIIISDRSIFVSDTYEEIVKRLFK